MADCIAEHCNNAVTHQHLTESAEHDTIGEFVAKGYCFDCAFWQETAAEDRTDLTAFVAERDDGLRHTLGGLYHYRAGTRKGGNPKSRGMYGKQYRIRLSTGKVLTTEDLWGQGAVPEAWQHLFARVPRGAFL